MAAARGASALFLASDARPFIRVEGDLRAAPVESALRLAFLHAVLPASRLGLAGPRIPALLLSAVVDVVCYGASLEQAVSSPHVSVRAADGTLEVEAELHAAGAPADALILGERDFGPICGITRLADGYLAAVDRRFESGLAVA